MHLEEEFRFSLEEKDQLIGVLQTQVSSHLQSIALYLHQFKILII